MVLCMRCVSNTGPSFLQRTFGNQTRPIFAKHGLRPKSTASSRQKHKQQPQTQRKLAVLSQKSHAPEQSPSVSTNASKQTRLVQRKPQTPLLTPLTGHTRRPISEQEYEPEPKSSGVYAPRFRLGVGVILIGSIIYSMVTQFILFSIAQLIYSHDS